MIGKEVGEFELLPRDLVDGTQNLLADFRGEIASPARLGHHLVGELFRGGLHHLMIGDITLGEDGRNGLKTIFAGLARRIHSRRFVRIIGVGSRHRCHIFLQRGAERLPRSQSLEEMVYA